jgi:hypothetical protein
MDHLVESMYEEWLQHSLTELTLDLLESNLTHEDSALRLNQQIINNIYSIRQHLQHQHPQDDGHEVMNDVFDFLFSERERDFNDGTSTTEYEDVKVTLTPEQFSKLHKVKVTGQNISSYDQHNCHICIESFAKGDALVQLPCLHSFHEPCIRKWLCEEKVTCPVCRMDIRN